MKTYEEKTQSVFQKIEEETAARRKRSRTVKRIAAPVLSLCLVAVIGFGAWQAGAFQKQPEPAFSSGPDIDKAGIPIPKPDGTIEREPMPEVMPSHPILRPGDEGYIDPGPAPIREPPEGDTESKPSYTADAPAVPDPQEPKADGNVPGGEGGGQVITGEAQKGPAVGTTGGWIYLWWNRLSVSGALKFSMDENPGGTFAVLATYRPATANITSFVYEGKTLAEWAVAADEELMLPEKMAELLKQGDELKYGTALYETGTPDGIKWDRAWYEDRVAYFGDLLNKYIVDGEFLREALEADVAALRGISITTPDGTTTVAYYGETSARAQYIRAWNAYLETVLPATVSRLTESGIQCSRVAYLNDALSLTVTAEQLKNLPLDDLGSWYFDLNSGDLKSAPELVTDAAGLQIVN